MAEEQRCQEGYRLCANNCGFLGSPATMDLCPKCYREKTLTSSSPPPSIPFPLSPASTPDSPLPSHPVSSSETPMDRPAATPGRCTECRKRVGLTGFRCRCGLTFCGPHRYPESHGCSFDYKAAGRESIARANPVVKGVKLYKI